MSIFDQLKRNKLPVVQTYSAAISGEKLFFLLRHDSKGSYIETVDQAGQETNLITAALAASSAALPKTFNWPGTGAILPSIGKIQRTAYTGTSILF
jgi:hypothetical protein